MDNWKKVFENYISNFDMNNLDIQLKYYHSLKVMELSKKISESMNMSNDDVNICIFIGLMHDLGRFEQIKKYNTFDDSISIDHAALSVKILFDDKMIEKFNIDKKYYGIIMNSIYNHNKYQIDSKIKDKDLLFAKIIRDADKVDIYRVLTSEEIKIKVGGNIRESILLQFYNKQCVKLIKNMSNNEIQILRFSEIFDINFNISLQLIENEKYIELLYNIISKKLNNEILFKDYYNYSKAYIKEKIKEK